MTRPRVLAAVLLAGAMTAVPADDIGHEAARRLRQAGLIVPLGDILADVTARHPGRVIETELERDDGRYVYEIELLGDDGHVYEFEFDAASGERLEFERKH